MKKVVIATRVNGKIKVIEKNAEILGTVNIVQKPIHAETITISSEGGATSVDVDKTLQLKAITTPAEITDKIEWSSLNPSVARVDNTGMVTGISSGKSVIKATAGEKSTTFEVTVNQPTRMINITYLYENYQVPENSNLREALEYLGINVDYFLTKEGKKILNLGQNLLYDKNTKAPAAVDLAVLEINRDHQYMFQSLYGEETLRDGDIIYYAIPQYRYYYWEISDSDLVDSSQLER